jgi:glycosyltransferase involved in cell wall biosynthesis
VLLAVCNGEPWLGDAIRSVLGQTFRDFELLVVDDASSDGSPATLAACGDPRLRVVRNEENLGLTRSLNRGLSLIESEYVARLDADDLSFPDRLERQVAFSTDIRASPCEPHGVKASFFAEKRSCDPTNSRARLGRRFDCVAYP